MEKIKVAGTMRMLFWPLVAVVLLVSLDRPEQLDVLAYKAAMVTLAAWIGYWIDRHLFSYARPHTQDSPYTAAQAMLRRALVVSSVILAFALGL